MDTVSAQVGAAAVNGGITVTERMSAAEYQKIPARIGGRRVTPETATKNVVKQWLTLNGWSWWWHLQSIGTYPGLPDLEAIREGRVVYLEIKSPRGKLSPAQEAFRDMITAAGGEYREVRSLDDVMDLA